MKAGRILSGTVLLATIAVGVARGQTTYPNIKLTGRLHEQFYHFDNSDYAATVGSQDNFFTRRARIEARVRSRRTWRCTSNPPLREGGI